MTNRDLNFDPSDLPGHLRSLACELADHQEHMVGMREVYEDPRDVCRDLPYQGTDIDVLSDAANYIEQYIGVGFSPEPQQELIASVAEAMFLNSGHISNVTFSESAIAVQGHYRYRARAALVVGMKNARSRLIGDVTSSGDITDADTGFTIRDHATVGAETADYTKIDEELGGSGAQPGDTLKAVNPDRFTVAIPCEKLHDPFRHVYDCAYAAGRRDQQKDNVLINEASYRFGKSAGIDEQMKRGAEPQVRYVMLPEHAPIFDSGFQAGMEIGRKELLAEQAKAYCSNTPGTVERDTTNRGGCKGL